MRNPGTEIDLAAVTQRLGEAAESGQALEVILVVRGTVRPVRGTDRRRWRMRIAGDHVLTFSADAVVATTPVPRARTGR